MGLEIQSEYHEYMNARVDNYDAQAMLHDAMLKKKVMDWNMFQKLPEGQHFNYMFRYNGRVEIVTVVLYLNCNQGKVYPDSDAYVGYDSCNGMTGMNYRKYHSASPLNMSDSHIEQYSMRQRIFYKCMKYNRDGEMFERIFHEHPEYGMDRELVLMLNSFLNITIPVPEKGETVIMCEAVRQMSEKYEARGLSRGITIGEAKQVLKFLKKGRISRAEALEETGMNEEQFSLFETTGEYPFLKA